MSRQFHVHHRLLAAWPVVVLAAACASTPPESAAQVKADRMLAARVEGSLDADPTFYFRHVDVWAYNGRVTLGGYVWSPSAIAGADRIASQTPGVTSVADELELERDGNRSGAAR